MAREIWDQNDAATHAPVKIERGKAAARSVDHTFTHFRLELSVVRATAEGSSNVDGSGSRPTGWASMRCRR